MPLLKNLFVMFPVAKEKKKNASNGAYAKVI
jgi:hypothetical protein